MKALAIEVGSTIQNGAAVVVAIDDKRVTVERVSTGSRVTVSRRLIDKTRERFESGDAVTVHANGSKGGISYTSTIEHTVLAAIGGTFTKADRCWKRA